MIEIRSRVFLPEPHSKQLEFIRDETKRKIIRAGRRGGKTVGMAIYSVEKFLQGRRILYAAPTAEQIGSYWNTVSIALADAIENRVYIKNETEHSIILPGTKQKIRAKTAWNADTLRGDYADVLILDEYQLMSEETWEVVGAPMLLDNDGDAVFIYTPPSLRSRSVSKAHDPKHAAKLFKKANQDQTGRWKTFHFTSLDNPHLSRIALSEIARDMTSIGYRMEILAEDLDEVPGALWHRQSKDENGRHIYGIEESRVIEIPGDLQRIVVGVDPSTTTDGDEAGIITEGRLKDDYYCLSDDSVQGSPDVWARAAVTAFHKFHADLIVAEKNNGGEMVAMVIHQIDKNVPVKLVWASRGKVTRAEPISAIAEQGRDHHVGAFEQLEDELCLWVQGDLSPNRLDAKVWAITELSGQEMIEIIDDPFAGH